MASSFHGTTIRAMRDTTSPSGALAGPSRQTHGSTRHVPYGGDVTQYTGRGASVWPLLLNLTAAEYAALDALVADGASHPLILAGINRGSWTLDSLEPPLYEVDGWVEVRATFRRLGEVAP